MQYELYYSTGGHGGPYPTAFEAKMKALRLLAGNKNEKWIDVKNSSINSDLVIRITRGDYYMVAHELGEIKPPTITKINMAQFEVKTIVVLYDVDDSELENSKVLHPDVLEQLQKNLEDGSSIVNFEITLDEVYELNKIED